MVQNLSSNALMMVDKTKENRIIISFTCLSGRNVYCTWCLDSILSCRSVYIKYGVLTVHVTLGAQSR
jgi:hypothetical protein